MSEDNKAIVRRFWEEAFSTGNLDVVDEIVSPEFVRTTTRGSRRSGIEQGVKQNITRDRIAFPDFRLTIEEMIAEGNKVAVRLTARGTHKGEFRSIPATGNEVTFGVFSMHRIANGKIVEEWRKWDRGEVMLQLGVTDLTRLRELA